MTNNQTKPAETERRRMGVEEEYWSRKFGVAPGQTKPRQEGRSTAGDREAQAKKG